MGVTAFGGGLVKASKGETKSNGDFDGGPDLASCATGVAVAYAGAGAGTEAADVGRGDGLLDVVVFWNGSRDAATTIGSWIWECGDETPF